MDDRCKVLSAGVEVIRQIIRLQLGRIARRMREDHRAAFTYSDDLVAGIAGRCTEVDSGARNVDAIINRNLLPEMPAEFLSRMAAGEGIVKVHAIVDKRSRPILERRRASRESST